MKKNWEEGRAAKPALVKNSLNFFNYHFLCGRQLSFLWHFLIIIQSAKPMTLNSVSAVSSSQETKLEAYEKQFYEISFLNTISLVFLKQANPRGLSRLDRILKLVTST